MICIRKFLPIFLIVFSSQVFSQEFDDSIFENDNDISINESSYANDNEDDYDDDLDSLFGDATDSDVAIETEVKSEQATITVNAGDFSIPLKFSGKLEADLGYAYIKYLTDSTNEGGHTGFFDLSNYLYFTARLDKTLAMRASLYTAMPYSTSDPSKVTANFELYEMYITYLAFDRLYLNLGKKTTTWGNIRLFSNDDDFNNKNDTDALYTNILTDSREGMSGVATLVLPFWQANLSAVALMRDKLFISSSKDSSMDMTAVSADLLSFAFSFDFVVWKTSVTFMARKFPSKDKLLELDGGKENGSYVNNFYQCPIIGGELKRTFFGFDVYGQELVRIFDIGNLKNLPKKDFSSIQKFSTTLGVYKWWDFSSCSVGFNLEYQNLFNHLNNKGEILNEKTNRIAFEGGLKRLGPKHNWKTIAKLNHNFTNKKGQLAFAITNSGLLSHSDWRTGVDYSYTLGESESKKLTFGTYIKINMDY